MSRTRGRMTTLRARRLWWVVARLLCRIVLLPTLRVRVFGERNVPRSGGALILSNHQSYLDPMLLSLVLHWPVSYMARRSLFRHPIFGRLIAAVNAFPVTREGRDIGALREAVRRLRDGQCLVLFPEGTRTTDGEIGPLQPSMLRIAARAEVPVVPAVIEGAFHVWPRKGRLRLYPVAVGYGRPIPAEECCRMSREEFIARLRAEMLKLRSELRCRMARSRGSSS